MLQRRRNTDVFKGFATECFAKIAKINGSIYSVWHNNKKIILKRSEGHG